MQAGIIEEMMDDAFESMEDQDELEEEAEAEIEKVLFELTAGATYFHYRYIPLQGVYCLQLLEILEISSNFFDAGGKFL